MPPNVTGLLECSIDTVYAPRNIISGVYTAFGSQTDISKYVSSRVRVTGVIEVWILTALTNNEDITFVYPLKHS